MKRLSKIWKNIPAPQTILKIGDHVKNETRCYDPVFRQE